MKNITYFFLAVLISFSNCGDDELKNPNYPIEPSIKFKELKFTESEDPSHREMLELTISYKDGDSDLGLTNGLIEEIEYPYHEMNLYLQDGTGDTTAFAVNVEYVPSITQAPPYIIKSASHAGVLVTSNTREMANYSYLPEYDPTNCLNYRRIHYFLDEDILDESFESDNSFAINTVTIGDKDFKLVKDLLLYEINENSYNISVKFYQFENGDFVEYDFYEKNYCSNYNGRFPIIDKKSGTIEAGPFKIKVKNPWEGQITYTMQNSSFLATFGARALKLEIAIKDRALHTSNTIVTPAFELGEIK